MTPTDLLDPLLGAGLKGYPPLAPPRRRSELAAQGWNVLAGDLPLPLAVLRRAPLQHNLGWMQRLVAAQGIALAPHGKTTMSPQLFQQQLAAGAWGITFASVQQLAIGVASGVRRALIANQVVQRQDLQHLAALQTQHADLQAMFLVDAPEQIALVAQAALPRPLDVLVELGLAGGRTGCRTHEAALALARAAQASPAVRLVGIACYEGLWGTGETKADTRMARGLMQRVHALATACDGEGLFEGAEVIVTAGGSALFDLVAPALQPALSKPVQGLLRSGCYLTHDDGFYRRMVHVANQRLGCAEGDGLRAALQLWCVVQSLPEPGLAILGCGKRDISFDMGLPVPLLRCAAGRTTPQPVPEGWSISALNDQHAYLRTGDAPHHLRVGDRLALGISHPCTTFDKWRWMPVVDEAWNVVDAITTQF